MPRLMVLAASIAVLLVAAGAAASRSVSSSGGWSRQELDSGSAYAINERGQIVGEFELEAMLWQNGMSRTLEAPEWLSDRGIWASAINDRGEVVGADELFEYALLWRDGKAQVLPSLAKGEPRWPADINNRGQIVGQSGSRPVVWAKGKPRALPGGRGEAWAINDRGVIAGVVGGQAVLWEQGKLRKLGTLGGSKSLAIDINEQGQVLGWGLTSRKAHGFLWQKGKMIDLGSGFAPEAINNRGQIVGSCRARPCVWQSGKLTQLEFGGYEEEGAVDINDRQQIVGNRIDRGGDFPLAFVLLWTYRP